MHSLSIYKTFCISFFVFTIPFIIPLQLVLSAPIQLLLTMVGVISGRVWKETVSPLTSATLASPSTPPSLCVNRRGVTVSGQAKLIIWCLRDAETYAYKHASLNTVLFTSSTMRYSLPYVHVAGSACYTVTSQDICGDIPLRTKLGVIRPDFTGTIWIPAGFQSHPPKVCFQPQERVCPSTTFGGVITTTEPPPTTTSPLATGYY